MSILIDPPRWPAHGTVFSHLVSDVGVEELHAFARDAGLPARAFDRDHYDVPAREYQRLVSAGAVEVDGRELVRRLVAGGVRVRARERPERHDGWLRRDFAALLPSAPQIAEDLLVRWSAPQRHYHDRRHLFEVLRGIDTVAEAIPEWVSASVPPERLHEVRLAAWWHDAVYDGVAGDDERASAELARSQLDGHVTPERAERVAQLILMTATHRPQPGDAAAALLSDADLRVLAATPSRYRRYVERVRLDYAHVPEPAFRAGRAAVLEGLLASDALFHTPHGRARWEGPARRNVEAELRGLAA